MEAVSFNGQENLGKTTWQSYGRFECELGHLGSVHTTLLAAVHLGKDYDTNLRYAKNHL